MTIFATLDATINSEFVIVWFTPFLEAPVLSMTNMVAFATLNDVSLVAISGLMTNLIALETHFFVAVKRLVSVFATKDAVEAFCVIWTLSSHMTKLLAVVAFHGNIIFRPVA
jgi:hypothetical protein